MEKDEPSHEGEATVKEAFPSSLEPPWKARRKLLAGVALPLALVAAGGAAVVIHLSIRGSSPVEESRGLNVGSVSSGEGGGVLPSHDSDLRWEQEAKVEASLDADKRGASGDADDLGASGDADDFGASGEDSDATLRLADAEIADELGGEQEVASASAVDQAQPVVDESKVSSYRGQIGKGNTISGQLGRHGLSGRQVNEIVDSLKGLFDFRESRPSHSYELDVSRSTGEIERFRYQAGAVEVFESKRRGAALVGERVKVDSAARWKTVGGRVNDSLAQSLTSAGLKRSVLRAFLQTFGREVSFQNEQRPDDTFRVVVEEEWLEEEFVRYRAVWAIEYSGKLVGRQRAFYFEPPEGRGTFFDEQGRSFDRTNLRTPCVYTRISSPFNPNRFHPVLKRRAPHRGVDLAAPTGTPIWATAEGTVTFAGAKGPNGNLVVLRHEGDLESMYAHLQKFARGLKRGQTVKQGEVIGYVGNTGRSTGPHLHFGIRLKGRFLDPMRYRSGPGRPIEGRYRQQFLQQARKLQRDLARIAVH